MVKFFLNQGIGCLALRLLEKSLDSISRSKAALLDYNTGLTAHVIF